jgi:hypothetical protein
MAFSLNSSLLALTYNISVDGKYVGIIHHGSCIHHESAELSIAAVYSGLRSPFLPRYARFGSVLDVRYSQKRS